MTGATGATGTTGTASTADATAVAPVAAPWIPIRSLSPRHRDRILAHLLALDERDRYLRFGHAAGDAQVERYVQSLDFEHDEVFGVFNRRLELLAMAHLALPRPGRGRETAAEFGGSVLGKARGRGYGGRLFEHAMLHTRNHGLDSIFIHALSENGAMLRIARRAGAVVQRSGSEAEAVLRLPPQTAASQVEQWVADGAAELDYRLKQQSLVVDGVLDALGTVRAGIARHTGQAGRD